MHMGLRPPDRVIDRNPILDRAVTSKPVEDKLRASMADKLKAQLGVGELSDELRTAVDAAAAGAARQVVELGLGRVADDAAREISRGNLLNRFDSKLAAAAASIGHIGQSSEVDKVLRTRAELLAKKKQSLVAAGFDDAEAMQIVLADIAARGH